MTRADYVAVYQSFDRSVAEAWLSGPPTEGLNACVECCDRWAQMDPDRPALYHVRPGEDPVVYSFGQLRDLSAQFACVLAAQGVSAGDRVAGLLPRTPELLATILA